MRTTSHRRATDDYRQDICHYTIGFVYETSE